MRASRTAFGTAITLMLAAASASGVSAQSAPAAAPAWATAAPDPARLAEARKLVDVLQPPATRERVFRTKFDAMMKNIIGAARADPTLAKATGDHATDAAGDKMAADIFDMVAKDVAANMPALCEAMARAYARRLSLPELQAAEQFFTSPAGQAYIANSNVFMSDPDIVAVQRDMIQRMMGRVPAMMTKMKQDAHAAGQAGAKKPGPAG